MANEKLNDFMFSLHTILIDADPKAVKELDDAMQAWWETLSPYGRSKLNQFAVIREMRDAIEGAIEFQDVMNTEERRANSKEMG